MCEGGSSEQGGIRQGLNRASRRTSFLILPIANDNRTLLACACLNTTTEAYSPALDQHGRTQGVDLKRQ